MTVEYFEFQPVNVRSKGGTVVNLDPALVLAIARTDDDESDVWRFDADGFLEVLRVRAEAEHLRVVLDLDDNLIDEFAPCEAGQP